MKTNRIIVGDALAELKKLPAESTDLVATDPPYGYSFMGKDWDKAVPSVDIWKECLRVLKPGAFMFVMSAPRSDVQMHMIQNITEAGFRMDFSPIAWSYASGFPKSARLSRNPRFCQCAEAERSGEYKDPSTQKDDHTGREDASEYSGRYQDGERRSSGIPSGSQDDYPPGHGLHDEQPPQEQEGGLSTPLQPKYAPKHTRSGESDDDQADESSHTPCQARRNGLPSKQGSENPLESEKGSASDTQENKSPQGGASTRKDNGIRGSDTQHTSSQSWPYSYCNKCGKPDAKGGFLGFQPKPAWEVVLVAMKPLSEKNFSNQAMKNGHGITWLDDGRIPTRELTPRNNRGGRKEKNVGEYGVNGEDYHAEPHGKGRFPANLLVSDDALNDGAVRARGHQAKKSTGFSEDRTYQGKGDYMESVDSYSRYFDLDAWFNERLKELPENVRKTFPFPAKASKIEAWDSESSTATSAEKKSGTGRPTELASTSSVPQSVPPSSVSHDQSLNASSAVKTASSIETDTAQKSVPIKLDTETLIEIISISASALTTLTTPNSNTKTSPIPAKDVESGKVILNDIIQTCQSLLKSFGFVNRATGEQTQRETDHARLLRNFEDLPVSVKRTFPFIVCPKASKSEKNKGLGEQSSKKVSNRSELYETRPVGISIDKMMEVGSYIKTRMEECGISIKQLNKTFGYIAGCNWWISKNPSNVRTISPADYTRLKTILQLDERYDELLLTVVKKTSRSTVDVASKYEKNHHPTVKPVKLMSYLITIGSRPGDLVLDPFVGSGTTCLAAESLGRKSIGIEKDPEYAEIAKARLKTVPNKLI